EKEENKGSVEFQVFSFTNKIRRLASHLNYTKKIFQWKEVSEDFWENVNDMSLPLTRKNLMIVNMGPHHPSMHGVFRLIVTLDGEDRNRKNHGKLNYYTILTLCNTLGLFSYYVYRSNN
ncbi:hypothetical protein E2562_035058, partial [Oryza meyeriana var. granulata]